ncbi:hypothetical protein [Lactococcus kimchii]|uniref:hypothetical protein n=1 Tax=Lactococcus sp. S-13 TaxID=2507158 RepID=UPI001023BA13|nr:hypothetical protein [Lactococcus sp. S-13]RZI49113.1 hypothetical protein EQJ87_06495 [Lactococcus sp. S-13]
MQKNEKNKAKDNLWLKQAGFFIVVLAWIVAIYFKKEMSGGLLIAVFIVLVLLTLGVLLVLNRAFFGLTASSMKTTDEQKGEENKDEK